MKNPKIQGRKESTIARELTTIFRTQLENETLKAVSVSEVRLINDNEVAKIFYSFIPLTGKDINEQTVKEALIEENKEIRKILASKLETRKVPELQFVLDESLTNANKIEDILKEVNHK